MKKKIMASKNIRFAAVAVDAILFRIFEGNLQIMVGEISDSENPYKGKLAHIGGLVHEKETAEDAIKRLLIDKAGLSNIYTDQLYTFSDIDRDPRGRVVSIAYLAILNNEGSANKLDAHETVLTWANVGTIPKLAYDHNKMAILGIERLKSKITYTDIARHFLPNEFTLSELQEVYEIILSKKIDKRNFRKQMKTLGMLKDTKKKTKQGIMRPAAIYMFK